MDNDKFSTVVVGDGLGRKVPGLCWCKEEGYVPFCVGCQGRRCRVTLCGFMYRPASRVSGVVPDLRVGTAKETVKAHFETEPSRRKFKATLFFCRVTV